MGRHVTLLGVQDFCKLLGILLHERSDSHFPFINLLNHLFITVDLHGHSFYTLGYNLILLYFFSSSRPSSGPWKLFPLALVPLSHTTYYADLIF